MRMRTLALSTLALGLLFAFQPDSADASGRRGSRSGRSSASVRYRSSGYRNYGYRSSRGYYYGNYYRPGLNFSYRSPGFRAGFGYGGGYGYGGYYRSGYRTPYYYPSQTFVPVAPYPAYPAYPTYYGNPYCRW